MKLKSSEFSIPILVVGLALSMSLIGISNVKASTMPASTIYLTPNATTKLQVGDVLSVFVYGDMLGRDPSDGVNGWDLVFADNDPSGTVLKPINVSIAGNFLSSFGQVAELINCVNGGAGFPLGQPGNFGCDSRDGPGIIHTTAVLQGGVPPTPLSGLLAKMSFAVVGTGSDNIGILSPCSGTLSCDNLTDGSATFVPHKTLGMTYNGTSPDFLVTTVDASPTNVGVATTSRVNVTSLNSYTGTVTVSTDAYPNTGLTISCGTFSPTTVPAGGSSSANCTLTPGTAGDYFVNVNVTDGSSFHIAPITVKAGGFDIKISGNPNIPTMNAGSSPIQVSGVNGFTGTVSLATKETPSTGLTVTCPTSLTVTASAPGTGTCAFSSSTPGTYTVTVTGTYSSSSGPVVETSAFPVNVGDFTVTTPAPPASIQASVPGSVAVQLRSLFRWGEFVTLSGAASPVGLTVDCHNISVIPGYSNPDTEYCSLTSSTPGSYQVNVTATCSRSQGCTTPVSRSAQFGLTVARPPAGDWSISASSPSPIIVGSPATLTIAVATTGSVTGTVSLTDTLPAGLTCGSITPPTINLVPPRTATLSCTSTSASMYIVTITGSNGTVSRFTTATFTFTADFSLSATSPVTSGTIAASIITVTGGPGFVDRVYLYTFGSAGLTCGPITPSSIVGSGTATLSCSSNSNGVFTVGIEGTTGTLTHSLYATFTFIVPDFTISTISPAPVPQNSTATLTIEVNSTNGFSGTVNLSAGLVFFGLQCGPITPLSITGSGTATLSCTSKIQGYYQVQVIGTSGSVTHSAFGFFQFTPQPDFDIYVSPSQTIVIQGQSSSVQAYLYLYNPQLGSSYTILLSARVNGSTNGLTMTFEPTSVRLSQDRYYNGYSLLTVYSLATTPAGDYTIIARGQLGSISHDTLLTVRVIVPPVITLTPTNGPIGTKVLIQGSHFLQSPDGSSTVLVMFDDQSVGFMGFTGKGFNFTFDVPVAQDGSHTVKVIEEYYSPYGGILLRASAEFQVTPLPAPGAGFTVNLESGTLYFPGGAATIFVQTLQNGVPTTFQNVTLTVIVTTPNGSTKTLTPTRIGTGLYKATWNVPSSGSLGTYAVTVTAHSASLGDASALANFEVQPTWLSSNRNNIIIGGATAAGMVGLVAFAWRKGYLRRGKNEMIWDTV